VTPYASLSPIGYGPSQFHSGYGEPTQTPYVTCCTGARKNVTIAIVDAYSHASISADLAAYDAAFGLPVFPDCSVSVTTGCLQIVNQSGAASPLPAADDGWGLEESLDVQAAHAMCQNCKILLVEASSSNFTDLTIAEQWAAAHAPIVSNSYGATGQDCLPSDIPGYDYLHKAIIASAGDNGFAISCPATQPDVISVGGTFLRLNADGSYRQEAVWFGSGGGCSTANATPAWQAALVAWPAIGCSGRMENDVAADADPNTGAAVYDSGYYGDSGWFQVGGTSLAAPLVAGVYGLAANAQSTAYSHPIQRAYAKLGTSALRDIVVGSNNSGYYGVCYVPLQCSADIGFDGPTGVGSPHGLGGF
jgi:subtilase family serine protease